MGRESGIGVAESDGEEKGYLLMESPLTFGRTRNWYDTNGSKFFFFKHLSHPLLFTQTSHLTSNVSKAFRHLIQD